MNKKSTSNPSLTALITVLLVLSPFLNTLVEAVPPKHRTPRKHFRVQQTTVTGTITDPNGQPVLGATVRIADSNTGTVTDLNGAYRISAQSGDILIFSAIGFRTERITVGQQRTIDLQLFEDITQLEEVTLNAGYYTVSERKRTGSIEKVTAADIEKQPISNPLSAIQGKMPGVYIQESTGLPGGDFKIRIRGTNSLRTNGNDPLYVIDGVPFPALSLKDSRVGSPTVTSSPLNNINPMDIQSLEILKDADATAIYGSRGANGVVLITTKKGSSEKTKFDLHMQSGTAHIGHRVDLLNTAQYIEMREEAFVNDNSVPTIGNAPDLTVWDRNRHTDWQDILLGGTAYMNNVQAAVSGGNEQTRFRVGGGFRNETTLLPGDFASKKINVMFNLNHRSKDGKFKVSTTASYVHTYSDMFSGLLIFPALRLAPNAPELYDAEGNLNWENNTWNNPLAELEKKYKNNTGNLITNISLSYELFDGLEISTSLGYNLMNTKESQYSPHSSVRPSYRAFFPRSANKNNSSLHTWIWEPQVNYSKGFGKLEVSTILGATLQETVNQTFLINAKGFNSDALMENFQAASTLEVLEDSETRYKYQALFGRINFNLAHKYILNITGRRDGSSRFGPGKQYGNFGAIGAAWLFSKESWLDSKESVLSYGKIRASYGTTGSDQIGNYQYLNLWSPTTESYQNSPGLTPTRLFNTNFGWETNRKLEMAVDLGFFNDRLLLNTSYFQNRSGNQLVGLPLPGTTGYTSIQSNLPATVENSGWELEVTSNNIASESFQWQTSINLSVLKNKLLDYPDLENSPYATTYVIDEPLSVVNGLRYTGVNPETGSYTFEDVNNDGFLSFPEDIHVLGNLSVDYFGGIQNSFQIGNLGFDFLIQGTKQSGTRSELTLNPPGFLSNQPVSVLDRWQNPGDITNVQKYTTTYTKAGFSYFNLPISDYTLVDASFLRLRNISLSYDIPFQKKSLANLRLYLQGQNLWTITNYKGLDPENPGVNQIPNLKRYTLGLQFNF